MIFEGIINIFIGLAKFIINLIPVQTAEINGSLQGVLDLMGFGIYIIGSGTFFMIISTVSVWWLIHFTWAVIEWIYKKIPGIS